MQAGPWELPRRPGRHTSGCQGFRRWPIGGLSDRQNGSTRPNGCGGGDRQVWSKKASCASDRGAVPIKMGPVPDPHRGHRRPEVRSCDRKSLRSCAFPPAPSNSIGLTQQRRRGSCTSTVSMARDEAEPAPSPCRLGHAAQQGQRPKEAPLRSCGGSLCHAISHRGGRTVSPSAAGPRPGPTPTMAPPSLPVQPFNRGQPSPGDQAIGAAIVGVVHTGAG